MAILTLASALMCAIGVALIGFGASELASGRPRFAVARRMSRGAGSPVAVRWFGGGILALGGGGLVDGVLFLLGAAAPAAAYISLLSAFVWLWCFVMSARAEGRAKRRADRSEPREHLPEGR